MSTTQTFIETLTMVRCPRKGCGVAFGITVDYERRRHNDHESFYCPNGHIQYFPQQSDLEAERAANRRLRSDLEWERMRAEEARRSAAAHKGHATRIRNLIAQGICPVPGCRRNFTNVRAHIASQHPDWHRHDLDVEGSR